MKKWLIIIVSVLLLGFSGQNASATLITFDDVASGTNINTQYSGIGVTFGCFNGTTASNMCTGNAYAVATSLANSAPNVISLTSSFSGVLTDERYGYFKASFSSLVGSVSIDAKAVLPPEYLGATTNKPFLQALGSGGAWLGTVEYTASVYGETWQTLTITHSTNDIAFIAFSSFSSSGHPVYGMFDNLNFSTVTTGGGGGTPVPEPSTLLLLGSGILGFGFFARKRMKG